MMFADFLVPSSGLMNCTTCKHHAKKIDLQRSAARIYFASNAFFLLDVISFCATFLTRQRIRRGIFGRYIDVKKYQDPG